jgi:osmotically-inducible protein OsmY
MSILRVFAVGTAVLIGGAYLVHLGGDEYGLRWPLPARAERALERARQRGSEISAKTARAADKAANKIGEKATVVAKRISQKTTVAATKISEKTSIAATRISEKTSVAATKISEKTTVAATKAERTVSETALSARIKAKMALDDDVKAGAIDVSTHGTTVTLSGTVASKAERARAVELARGTAGVTRVVDELHTP